MKHRIVSITQVYNELHRGNLIRFVEHLRPLVDRMVFFDDGSTDGTAEYLLKQGIEVLRSPTNDFKNELTHRQAMLERALQHQPDFVLRVDADEVFSASAAKRLPELCDKCVREQIDGLSFRGLNLWRSGCWERLDDYYGQFWVPRLWRVVPGMRIDIKPGLHQAGLPTTLKKVEKVDDQDVSIIHYGFADDRQLAFKFLTYRGHGQSGWGLSRLLDEKTLKTRRVPADVFPPSLRVDEPAPQQRSLTEAVRVAQTFRGQVTRPGVSIVCLIYKSTAWLDYVYQQLMRHTDLTGHEFLFVANEPNESVLRYLQDHYIPHEVYREPPGKENEWYINRVYRAWNHAAKVARGDLLLFINSDMGFSPNWVENLRVSMTAENCVASRLVESGKMPSGLHGISKNFGRSIETYDEAGFLKYADSIRDAELRDDGLFMPLMIRRDHFWQVKGYPEGNAVPGTDIFNPGIAGKGEPCVPGDVVLMQKLKTIGVHHQTSFNSIVYHFQEGEMGDKPSDPTLDSQPMVVMVHPGGPSVEHEPWKTLASLPRAVVVDATKMDAHSGADSALSNHEIDAATIGAWIRQQYPQAMMIVQSSELPAIEDSGKFVVVWLERNARGHGSPDEKQDQTLRAAHLMVTDSEDAAAAYWDFDFQILPQPDFQALAQLLQRVRLRIEIAKVRHSSVDDLKLKRFYVVKPRPFPLQVLDRIRRSMPRIKPFRRWPCVARVYLTLVSCLRK